MEYARIVPEESSNAYKFILRVPNAGTLNRSNAKVRVVDGNHLRITVKRRWFPNGAQQDITSDYMTPLNGVPYASIHQMLVQYSDDGVVTVNFPKEPLLFT